MTTSSTDTNIAPAEAEKDEKPTSSTKKKGEPAQSSRTHRALSVRVSTAVVATVVVALIVVIVVIGAFLWSARNELSSRDRSTADTKRAEQVATDYAVGASTLSFNDINAWVGRLKANTSPELANKFDATAPKLQQILVPLQWNSTAAPIGSTSTSPSSGIYKVNVFVNVSSTSSQNPQGAQTTVTYNVTVDRGAGWKVTDVGGVDAALPLK
ncbi:hypothetical protein [Nocardia nova]|uniref:hypothetical protein n=1 Tax=Nocardia nova TaxID=37330 RepID=UPI0033CE829D